ncbi:betaine--homocysteine S-methyltransferase 1-like isoform X1 [Oculina patagonica]
MESEGGKPRGILERLNAGEVVIGDGGFLHALERRGYLKAGVYTPECTVEHPDAVRQLHREFLRAGADVMQAFTFNATEESIVSRGVSIKADAINQAACTIAREVANEGDALVAGGVSYTRSYTEGRGKHAVQEEYMKQVQVLIKNDVDFLIAEYLMNVDEAEWATESLKSTGKTVATTLPISPQGDRYGKVTPREAAVRIAKAGADIIGVNCLFEPDICLRTVQIMRDALNASGMPRPLMVQPVAYKTPDADRRGMVALPESPFAMECRLMTRWEMHKYARAAYDMGIRYIGGCCGFEPYHIRALAEELSPERGKLPAASEQHGLWGEALKYSPNFSHKVGREYWENLKPASGRPDCPPLSGPSRYEFV